MRACVVHSQDVDSVDAVAELIAGAVSGVARSVSTDVWGSIRASVDEAVQRLAGTGGNGGAPSLCITMPDGLTVSGSAALDALRAIERNIERFMFLDALSTLRQTKSDIPQLRQIAT